MSFPTGVTRGFRALSAGCAFAVALGATPAQAHEHFYEVALVGNGGSGATGVALVTLDLDLVSARIEGSFAGLLGSSTAIHLHCCTAAPGAGTALAATSVGTPSGFALGVQSGSFDVLYDLTLDSTYNPLFIAASGGATVDALNALIFGAEAGTAYLSISSTAFPGGELRGFLIEPVPEPASVALMLGGIAAIGWKLRRRQAA